MRRWHRLLFCTRVIYFLISEIIGLAGFRGDLEVWLGWLKEQYPLFSEEVVAMEQFLGGFIIQLFLVLSGGLVITYPQWYPKLSSKIRPFYLRIGNTPTDEHPEASVSSQSQETVHRPATHTKISKEIEAFSQRRKRETSSLMGWSALFSDRSREQETSDLFIEVFGSQLRDVVESLKHQNVDVSGLDYAFQKDEFYSPDRIYKIHYKLERLGF